jgi:hypothetical protein
MPGIISTPWTPQQVATLNRYQRESGVHPFTCGAQDHFFRPTLLATVKGWRCPDPECTFTQEWALEAMTLPEQWPSARVHSPDTAQQDDKEATAS